MSEDQKKNPGLAGTVEERLTITVFITITIPAFMALAGITTHPVAFVMVLLATIALIFWSFSVEKYRENSAGLLIFILVLTIFLIGHLVTAQHVASPSLYHSERVKLQKMSTNMDEIIEYANENGYSEIRLEAHHSPKFRESAGSDFTTPIHKISSQKFIYRMDREFPIFEELDIFVETPVEGEEVCRDIGSIRGKTDEICEPPTEDVELSRPVIIKLDDDGEVESVNVEQG